MPVSNTYLTAEILTEDVCELMKTPSYLIRILTLAFQH
jgi:hypothetical protein